ncbi:unnamed protein product [Cylindrotheca closterium]|uniref:HSF-type DNA-binding domain-containing protein n=1 Tax=Cylindrotheca closterium TaxID=2856 RepID=A0AAD2PXX9_9STRA|nr:unnamed protein product [Cylindrotheca closterium]
MSEEEREKVQPEDNKSMTADANGSDTDQASEKDEGEIPASDAIADIIANGSSLYLYRDFSNVAEAELEDVPASSPPPSRAGVETSIRVQKFPVKLYAILAQKEFNEIITWQPHGRAWKVLKPQAFESLVMPLFFEYSNYHSFNRLVNAWSFRRISSGPDRGSYYHELFLRGKPHLQKFMRRLPKTHKKLPMKKEDEPDFYDREKITPLPGLDESQLPVTSIISPMKRSMAGSAGIRPSLTGSLPAGTPGLGMRESLEASREQLLNLNPRLGLNPQFGALAPFGGMSQLNSMQALGRLGGMGALGAIGCLGGGLTSFNPGAALGPPGSQGIGAALRASQLGVGLGLNNPGFMNPSNNPMDLRRLQELEAMERQAFGLGAANR